MVFINTPDPDSCPANYVLISRSIVSVSRNSSTRLLRKCLLDEWIDRTATPSQHSMSRERDEVGTRLTAKPDNTDSQSFPRQPLPKS